MILGSGGDDVIRGAGGNDLLCAGTGDEESLGEERRTSCAEVKETIGSREVGATTS